MATYFTKVPKKKKFITFEPKTELLKYLVYLENHKILNELRYDVT